MGGQSNAGAAATEEAYNQEMLAYQWERAALGLPYESWHGVTGKGYTAANKAQAEVYAQMVAEAEALKAAAPPPDPNIPMTVEEAAQAQANTAVAGSAPIKPLDPSITGKAKTSAINLQNTTQDENLSAIKDNVGSIGNNLMVEPDTFASREQIDQIRALEKKIADDTGGSLKFGDYGRMSTGEANTLLDKLKAEAGYNAEGTRPESGLYNPNPPAAGPENLGGPEGVPYNIPKRPPPRFAPPTGQQTAEAGALRGGLDLSQGNPFQAAAAKVGFNDANNLGAQVSQADALRKPGGTPALPMYTGAA